MMGNRERSGADGFYNPSVNHKTRLNYGTGASGCFNPQKCICYDCKEKRAKAAFKKIVNKNKDKKKNK